MNINQCYRYIESFGLKIFSLKFFSKLAPAGHIQGMIRNAYFRNVYAYFNESCQHTIDKYRNVNWTARHEGKEIWMCWWQGIKEAPELVKVCVESVKRNAEDWEIHIIDKDNYKQYIEVPEIIMERFNANQMSVTHLSDYLRMALLARYGGVWMDATIFVTQPVQEPLFLDSFITVDSPDDRYIHKGIWSSFLLGGNKIIFCFCRDAILEYWEKNEMLIDYFDIDIILYLAYQHFTKFSDIVQNRRKTEYDIYCLEKVLDKKYDSRVWDAVSHNGQFYKLNWKKKHKGKETFYEYLLHGCEWRG